MILLLDRGATRLPLFRRLRHGTRRGGREIPSRIPRSGEGATLNYSPSFLLASNNMFAGAG